MPHVESKLYRRLWGPVRRLESLQPHAKPRQHYSVPVSESDRFIFVRIRGGFHEIRSSICDAVVIARLLNATLVVPEIQSTTSNKGISAQFKSFAYLYSEDQFMTALANDITVVKTLPKTLKGARRKKEIPSFKVVNSQSPYYYLHHVLPVLKRHSVVELVVSDGGCLQAILPPDLEKYQRLRCRVAFHALSFRQEVQELATKILHRSRTAVAPLERLKILLQVQNPHAIKYNGTIQGLKYIWRNEGFRGLFKGNGTNCARIVPNSAVKFFSYEEASKGILWLYRQQPGNEDAELTPVLRLGAGACAGIIAMSATYPMDLVRGRITVQTDKSPTQYRGIAHALATVLREEGPRALYKGWLPSVIGVVPYVGLNFAVYESLKDWLVKSKPFGLAEDTELSVTTKLACGAAAGTVGQTVAYPLDVIRRRMQMVGWKHAASVVTADGKSALEYTGMVDAFRKTVRYEGFGALYKGLVPNSVKVVPSIAIAFVSYEVVKDLLGVEMRISD